jgi:hypothetical protein
MAEIVMLQVQVLVPSSMVLWAVGSAPTVQRMLRWQQLQQVQQDG